MPSSINFQLTVVSHASNINLKPAVECRAPKSLDTKYKESTRRTVPVETSASTALVSCDGLGGYDWSDQAEEGPHYALMAYTSTSSDSKESTRRTMPVETPTSTALVSCDVLGGYDWSDQAEEGPNYALMAYTSTSSDSKGNPQIDLQVKGVNDSGCSRHMTGNMPYFTDYEEINGGYVAFGGNPKGGKITGKVIDESQVLLRVPRKNNMYNIDLKNIVPKEGLTCLFAKATSDESKLWHKMLRHLNFKTMNKMVKGNLVREAVNIACYVQNRVLVVKPHNTTSYELFHGRTPSLSFMKPFGCSITILNTLDHLGKFNGKADKGFFVGYSLNSKAFRVFNSRTKIVEDKLHIRFSENTPNVVGQARKEKEPVKYYILLPLWTVDPPFSQDPKSSQDDGFQPSSDSGKKVDEDLSKGSECKDQQQKYNINNTNNVNAANTNRVNNVDEDLSKGSECKDQQQKDNINNTNNVNAANTNRVNNVSKNISNDLPFDPIMPALEDIDFVMYQMDVKSDFLYGKIEKEVYVCQPPGFEDPDSPDKVYKVEKALYGLHQSPREWYETLSTYLLDNGFHSGKIYKTLFIRRQKGDILLVQVYVDDIIFGSTKKDLCNAFRKMMHEKFQMSYMGELTFFLGLQVK
nr:putative ribonuclease H-like domain-containing protein [Tanacetum cinerariifolium]